MKLTVTTQIPRHMHSKLRQRIAITRETQQFIVADALRRELIRWEKDHLARVAIDKELEKWRRAYGTSASD